MFSSQVLPIQAVFTAKEEFEKRTGKDIQKNINKALHSKPGASATNSSSSYYPGSAKRKNKRRRRRFQSGGRFFRPWTATPRGRSPNRLQQHQQDRGSRPPSAGPKGGRGAG
jgi:hypothetical protein